MKTQKEEEIRKVPASCDRFCLLFKSSFSLVSIRRDSVLLLEKVTPKSQCLSHTHTQRHIHTHIYTHTHAHIQPYTCMHIETDTYTHTYTFTHTHILITTYSHLWSMRLLHVHHLEHTASGAEKRVQKITLGLFPPPLRSDTCDTTLVSLPRMSH